MFGDFEDKAPLDVAGSPPFADCCTALLLWLPVVIGRIVNEMSRNWSAVTVAAFPYRRPVVMSDVISFLKKSAVSKARR